MAKNGEMTAASMAAATHERATHGAKNQRNRWRMRRQRGSGGAGMALKASASGGNGESKMAWNGETAKYIAKRK
jgi:hypothetical protein